MQRSLFNQRGFMSIKNSQYSYSEMVSGAGDYVIIVYHQ